MESKLADFGELNDIASVIASDAMKLQGKQPEKAARTVYLLDPMLVRDLADAISLKPFQVVADLMELKLFKSPEDEVDFETAAIVARKHGYRPERPPPGTLVL